MTEPVRWRLTSLFHQDVDEPEEGASIRIAASLVKHRLLDLQLFTSNTGKSFVRIPLADEGGGWIPIFYRRRSMSLGKRESSLDAIVFGRAREGNATLWLLRPSGQIVDCPQELFDAVAIRGLVEGFSGLPVGA